MLQRIASKKRFIFHQIAPVRPGGPATLELNGLRPNSASPARRAGNPRTKWFTAK